MDKVEIFELSDLEHSFDMSRLFVSKNYLSSLNQVQVMDIPENIKKINIQQNVRLFKINKLVYDKNENLLDKLSNFYTALGNVKASVILIIDSNGYKTDIYIGAKVCDSDFISATQTEEIVRRSFKGNFSGSDISILRKRELDPVFEKIMESQIKNNETVISCVSGIPSLKDEDKDKFVQGIEKLIEAMHGSVYTGIFIADPVEQPVMETIKSGYEEIYTQLSPFSSSQYSYGENESEAVSVGLTKGITNSISESISKTQSYTEGTSNTEGSSNALAKTETQGNTKSEGKSNTTGSSTSKGKSKSNNKSEGISFIIFNDSSSSGDSKSETQSTNKSTGSTSSTGTSNSKAQSKTDTKTKSWATTKSDTKGSTKQTTKSESTSNSENKSTTNTQGTSINLQIQHENRAVNSLLEQINLQLNRINHCKNFGMWNCACYFVANDVTTTQVAASTYKSLMRGELSSTEDSYINTWDTQDKVTLNKIKSYLQHLSHPLFDINIEFGTGLPYVTPGSLISGNELAIQFSLPKKSVAGLPVMSMAEFGRNITTYDKKNGDKIKLGHIFHMGNEEEIDVEIDLDSLGMHTFVTGSTGSGKSNTIYKLLNEVNKEGIKFLVIEPAKGEYKEVFGGRTDVNVFGTNPKYTEMLKINPFKFPDDIHVLEHIDRLIEIFNACWPMYAAMPAILKEAIELAYEQCGWDLDYSICLTTPSIYPTFTELLETLNSVIEGSRYSQELKSNYTGALSTRVKSLTNGLLGRIFNSDEIDNRVLFDENTIADLSRIGSTETKSLITGILFIKLQEYRMTTSVGCNSKLRHLTVLEEAHNLLRKTSTAQTQEGSNLQGKSVEMISNAIAEMRTYGEGFVISDQAPNLLDDSVIRNTNTKIILRLPQHEDRESVGHAISLNDNQISEIPKLETGVAVIYQNNWLEPILCKVDEFNYNAPLNYTSTIESEREKQKRNLTNLLRLLMNGRVVNKHNLEQGVIDELLDWIPHTNLEINMKQKLIKELKCYSKLGEMELWEQNKIESLSSIVSSLVNRDKMIRYAKGAHNLEDWTLLCYKYGSLQYAADLNFETQNSIIQCILSDKAREDSEFKQFYFKWVEEMRGSGGRLA